MKKLLQLEVEIKLLERDGQTELVLEFSRSALRDLCLGLCLLSESLVEDLAITGVPPGRKVNLRRYHKSKAATARLSTKQGVSVAEISENGLAYVRTFFLKYYRDGAAEVDHIHLEAIDGRTNARTADITFKVPDSKPPLSPTELRRLLAD